MRGYGGNATQRVICQYGTSFRSHILVLNLGAEKIYYLELWCELL
jgi:hypothetical protein